MNRVGLPGLPGRFFERIHPDGWKLASPAPQNPKPESANRPCGVVGRRVRRGAGGGKRDSGRCSDGAKLMTASFDASRFEDMMSASYSLYHREDGKTLFRYQNEANLQL